ncbi:reverse transcriptase domain-containing protein [Clostridium sulfidigenes]|uniref:reverse transcriptase domain-containing protein n=1 Tax=Clostridium sulfidigenes TaxID=318464 RepID=UPI003F8891B6
MLSELSKDTIINYFYKLKPSLKTGSDRITPKKFESIICDESKLIINKINNKTYKFSRYTNIIVKNNRKVYSPTIRDRIVLDILKDILIKKYKIKFQDRNKICSKIKRTLENGCNFTIIRLDIQDFYGSIPHYLMFKKLKSSSLLSDAEYLLIKKALSQSNKGVLQGLPISNCLAEIYLESFDKEVKAINSKLCYFARYVDDIILIFNGYLLNSEIDTIKARINFILSTKLKLDLNESKSVDVKLNDKSSFEYLGYTFKLNFEFYSKKNYYNKITLDISPKKINKIKDKLSKYFYDYSNDNNFNHLYQRLTFITSSCYGLKFKQYYKNNKLDSYREKICFGVLDSYHFATSNSFDLLNAHITFLIKFNASKFNNKQKKLLFNCKFNNEKPHFINFHKFTNDQYINLITQLIPTYTPPTLNTRHTVIYDYFCYLNA